MKTICSKQSARRIENKFRYYNLNAQGDPSAILYRYNR